MKFEKVWIVITSTDFPALHTATTNKRLTISKWLQMDKDDKRIRKEWEWHRNLGFKCIQVNINIEPVK